MISCNSHATCNYCTKTISRLHLSIHTAYCTCVHPMFRPVNIFMQRSPLLLAGWAHSLAAIPIAPSWPALLCPTNNTIFCINCDHLATYLHCLCFCPPYDLTVYSTFVHEQVSISSTICFPSMLLSMCFPLSYANSCIPINIIYVRPFPKCPFFMLVQHLLIMRHCTHPSPKV